MPLNVLSRRVAEQKLFHKLGNRRQVLCIDMSGFSTRGPTFPTLGFLSRKSASASRHPGKTITSGFTSAIYRPVVWRMATLFPFAKPRFSPLLISFTHGYFASIISAEPPEHALSTTPTPPFRPPAAFTTLPTHT